jgi:hypothetical protein
VRYLPLLALGAATSAFSGGVLFNRDVRPILSDKCFTCHGPDAPAKNVPLRLDSEEAARSVITSGELLRRITAQSKALRMPPAYSGLSLSEREIGVLKEWVEQGGKWEPHWAFVPPKRWPLPAVQDAGWPRNAIDRFVLARLEQEGLKPSPEAGRATLLRRVSLDLTGLPPSIEELDRFLADDSPDAYERAVDRLLASPRYGERMALPWLEAARYADTNGYQTDAERYMWRWRDWVIEAFSRNMPFDQFTIEQIAGDMLPKATLEQKIASGFNRNHRGNGEGGIIPEEYAVEYVADRVETTGTVFLGLTLGCARCHTHKYDPFTQKEFYQLFAYFNNIPEPGRYFKYGNTPPFIHAPTREQQAKLSELEARVAAAERTFQQLRGEAERAQREWEQSLRGETGWAPERGLVKAIALEDPRFDGKRVYDAGDIAPFGFYDRFTLSVWVNPENVKTGAILSRGEDIDEGKGYGLLLKDGRVQLYLVQRWLDDALRVESAGALPARRWSHVAVSYDGSRLAKGVRIYINGEPQKLNVLLDELNQEFRTKEPFRIGGGNGQRFAGEMGEVRIYSEVLSEDLVAALSARESLAALAAIQPAKRTRAQQEKLRHAFLEEYSPPDIRQAWKEMIAAHRAREAFLDSVPTVMVMEEMPQPRETFLLVRGAYDKPGERVQPGVPAALPPLPPGVPNNRLGFAQWLVHPSNPLTARVTVNRLWQMIFGTGLVRTVEDFGSQGEWPSHLELLDWLAVEFMESGWDVKHMLKLMVTSAAYRQSSSVRPELAKRDPENRLLARGPRLRLNAAQIRDQALFVSGLLVEKIGGPSVRPYQPAGLWKELSGGGDYKQDSGENLYRRSLYTFWKRAAPPPFMMNFDSAGRETCIVRETRTNTPLQALNLMNDVTFVEASRHLAERVMKRAATTEERVRLAFRMVTARHPDSTELDVLVGALNYYRDAYQSDPGAARSLLSQGESPRDESLDASGHAAYTMLMSMILNLDEAITKE